MRDAFFPLKSLLITLVPELPLSTLREKKIKTNNKHPQMKLKHKQKVQPSCNFSILPNINQWHPLPH